MKFNRRPQQQQQQQSNQHHMPPVLVDGEQSSSFGSPDAGSGRTSRCTSMSTPPASPQTSPSTTMPTMTTTTPTTTPTMTATSSTMRLPRETGEPRGALPPHIKTLDETLDLEEHVNKNHPAKWAVSRTPLMRTMVVVVVAVVIGHNCVGPIFLFRCVLASL